MYFLLLIILITIKIIIIYFRIIVTQDGKMNEDISQTVAAGKKLFTYIKNAFLTQKQTFLLLNFHLKIFPRIKAKTETISKHTTILVRLRQILT